MCEANFSQSQNIFQIFCMKKAFLITLLVVLMSIGIFVFPDLTYAQVVEGVCAATHYNCISGYSNNQTADSGANGWYHWYCSGTGGGSFQVCAEAMSGGGGGGSGGGGGTTCVGDGDCSSGYNCVSGVCIISCFWDAWGQYTSCIPANLQCTSQSSNCSPANSCSCAPNYHACRGQNDLTDCGNWGGQGSGGGGGVLGGTCITDNDDNTNCLANPCIDSEYDSCVVATCTCTGSSVFKYACSGSCSYNMGRCDQDGATDTMCSSAQCVSPWSTNYSCNCPPGEYPCGQGLGLGSGDWGPGGVVAPETIYGPAYTPCSNSEGCVIHTAIGLIDTDPVEFVQGIFRFVLLLGIAACHGKTHPSLKG